VGVTAQGRYAADVRASSSIAVAFFTPALIAVALSLAGGCQGARLIDFDLQPDGGVGGGPPFYDAGSDQSDGESPTLPDAGDAGPEPVFVGIQPSPKTDGDGEPSAGDHLEAKLTTLAAGVRVAVIRVPWRALAAGGEADLAAEVAFYEKYKRKVIVNLAFVDRRADARPDELTPLSWDDPQVIAAADATLDGLLQTIGPSLSALTFGRDVDVFIESHPEEREALEAFIDHVSSFAKKHPAAPPELKVAAGVSFEGLVVSPSPSIEALLASSDIAAISYIPGLAEGGVAPASEVATQLDHVIAAAAGKPILLQAVGYPSDPLAGSSLEKQSLFFETFWGALGPRRAFFPWVNVAELHDLGPAACDAHAASQGEPKDSKHAAFFCSLGLFTSAGEQKPAWSSVLEAAATFASP
jgi:hypothetical protein